MKIKLELKDLKIVMVKMIKIVIEPLKTGLLIADLLKKELLKKSLIFYHLPLDLLSKKKLFNHIKLGDN